ncbi:helix-turn-helix domain-containing protein [Streptomyces sp. NBC_01237]|uniref:helix-turn-helix domain-containing protein n=1 Tax=Streptomyces sp. NBC_01237 TaxID=2903790 RepID=UPI002DD9C964|nr:transcriptional regulator [Streptomyces sp. NBC_01237]WRZ77284.1 transcriptional regulator [Streptomyces sp. NBC_01237]
MTNRQHSDPPGMPEDERMTPAELRVVREYLGLTPEWLAAHLNITGRQVRNWEQGKSPILDTYRLEIQNLERYTGDFVSAVRDRLMDLPDPGVITYRNDAEYRAAHPEVRFPASWHRAVIARVAQEVRGLTIAYADEVSESAAGT